MALPSTSTLLDPVALLSRAGVRAGQKVADLGCGALGHFVFPAAAMVGGEGKVYAVDILKSVLGGVMSRAKLEGAGNVETVWGDCEVPNGVRIGTGSVDLTLVVNNLYQAKDRNAFMREAVRITKPGGTIVVSDWKTTSSPLGPPAEKRVAATTALKEAMGLGLKLKEEFEPGQYHWGLIFTR